MPTFDLLFEALAESPKLHSPNSAFYRMCKVSARAAIEPLFASRDHTPREFGPFGSVSLPYTKMGAIDSLDLFGLDELIIFAFYHANRARYRHTLDIGANLGLHSIIMARCGFSVRAFEPDPWHYSILVENLTANSASTVESVAAAVSTKDGQARFVRVLGNTTGSHLEGSKDSYGEKEFFTVPTRAAGPLFAGADFAKIDAEGHEKELLLTVTRERMEKLDVMVEIGNAANAEALFKHFQALGVGMFSQKTGWNRVQNIDDMPKSHRDGSLFITLKPAMPW